MGGGFNAAVMNGDKNLWGDPLVFFEPESEHSAATVCEGFAVAGGRVTNFTSGQGLVLMKEVLYTISGKRLPVVMNIGARALTSQGLNVHAGHDDVMSVADVGWGMIFARNAQEAGDFCLICRRAAEATQTPFFNVQDGFLTTHTVETRPAARAGVHEGVHRRPQGEADQPDGPGQPDDVRRGAEPGLVHEGQDRPALVLRPRRAGILEECVRRVLPEDRPALRLPRSLPLRRRRVHPRRHGLLHGDGQGDRRLPARQEGHRGRLPDRVACSARSRPGRIVEALKHCKAFTVLERMDDPLSTTGNHLTREIKAAFCDAVTGQNGQTKIDRVPQIYSAAAGLGSRDVRPGDIIATFHNMMKDKGQDFFCVGIDHPLALKRGEDPDLRPHGGFSMRGHSVGGFGSVTTNKVIATIAGNVFGKDVQAYPKYGSEKKGLPTTYYLTIADSHIFMHSELEHVDLAVHQRPDGHPQSHEPLDGLMPGGAIFMQSPYADPAEVWKRIPGRQPEDHPRPQAPRLLLRHGEDRPRSGLRSPTCRCACRASCCSARSSSSRPTPRKAT